MMGWKLKKRLRYSLIEQDSKNSSKHKGTFFIGPRHVKDYSTKEFIEFNYVEAPNFTSEANCKVFAQNSHVAIEIYDYYTKLFNPDYETVSVYDERFIVQYLFKEPDKWRNIGTYNPTIQVIPLENGVEIKRTFDTDYGEETLEVSYIIRIGAFLKHKITFTNKTEDTKTFRVIMKLTGITSNKIKYKQETIEISNEKSIGKQPFFFIGEDNQHLKLTEYLWSLGITDKETGEWIATKLKDIIFDAHAQGCKVDIIIGNYILNQNESLLIDPLSDTWQVSTDEDDCYRRLTTDYWALTGDLPLYAGCSSTSLYQYGCGLKFNNIEINKNDIITSANLKFCCAHLWQGTPVNTQISADNTDNALEFSTKEDFDTRWNNRTIARVNWDNIPEWSKDVEYTSPSIISIIQEIIDLDDWQSDNNIALFWDDYEDRTPHSSDCIRSIYSYGGKSASAAELIIEWTNPPEYYNTITKKLDIPDNISNTTIAERIETWLDSLEIPTSQIIYSIDVKHDAGFWRLFIVYEE